MIPLVSISTKYIKRPRTCAYLFQMASGLYQTLRLLQLFPLWFRPGWGLTPPGPQLQGTRKGSAHQTALSPSDAGAGRETNSILFDDVQIHKQNNGRRVTTGSNAFLL